MTANLAPRPCMAPPPPRAVAPLPPFELLRAGQRLPVAWGHSTVLPDWDVETYSEAGFEWDSAAGKYKAPIGATKKGLPAVGSTVYFEHPSADIFCMAYDLKDGRGRRRWKPGQPLPGDLISYLATFDPTAAPGYAQSGIIESHNSGFEMRCAVHVLHLKYNWPLIDLRQLRCSMAKARAYSLPGKLENLAMVLRSTPKNPNGEKLIKLFSVPQNPTKTREAGRLSAQSEPEKASAYEQYNEDDIVAEADASARIPDLMPQELAYWLADQACNWRGVGVDLESVNGCISVLQQAHAKYNAELYQITGGEVARASEISKLKEWVAACTGYRMKSGDTEAVEAAIAALCKRIDAGGDIADLSPVLRALEIRNLIGSAAVKKVYAMARMATREQRLCDLFIYHGARTGRDTHADVQPGNLPKSGPRIRWCTDVACNRPYAHRSDACPWCGASATFSEEREGGAWMADAVEDALSIMRHGNLELVEYFFGDAVLTISGCVRGLLVAAPGKKLICSDYSSVEAVVTAVLSGEPWRIAAFERKEDIYLHGAAAITGKTYEWYMANGGKKHPDRQKIGKVSELALGFGGWIGSWRNFDKSDNFTDEQVKANIVAWREASPMLVELWGGQVRGKPWRPERYELYGLEGMAIAAIQNPGQVFAYRGLGFQMLGDTLFLKLLSGRRLTYHSPRLERQEKFQGVETWALTFMTWNSNPAMGPLGWTRMETWGSRLCENVVQATARDVMAHAVVNLERSNYPVVLRVHDEIASEIDDPGDLTEAQESALIQHFESIMADLPDYAKGWPIRAAGGWIKKRYRKD